MTSPAYLFEYSKIAMSESEIARRIALAIQPYPDERRGKPSLARLIGELDLLVEPARRLNRKLDIPQTRNPQTIIIMPGFAASPKRMRYLARNLERAGHTTKDRGMGRNWGMAEEGMECLEERLFDVCERCEQSVVLLGWSLGGLYARELTKRHPICVHKVITMGSPFSGSPRANNVWRAYQAIAGHRVDEPPIETDLSIKPPVETVAMWSSLDGAVAARCAAGLEGERDRAIGLRCTHAGFTYRPQSILAVLAEIDR